MHCFQSTATCDINHHSTKAATRRENTKEKNKEALKQTEKGALKITLPNVIF